MRGLPCRLEDPLQVEDCFPVKRICTGTPHNSRAGYRVNTTLQALLSGRSLIRQPRANYV